jgi:hypothetical protein
MNIGYYVYEKPTLNKNISRLEQNIIVEGECEILPYLKMYSTNQKKQIKINFLNNLNFKCIFYIISCKCILSKKLSIILE